MNATQAVPLAIEFLESEQILLRNAANEFLVAVVGESEAATLAESHKPPAWKAAWIGIVFIIPTGGVLIYVSLRPRHSTERVTGDDAPVTSPGV